jgi:DNA-binding NarL/FixJ family response regulator
MRLLIVEDQPAVAKALGLLLMSQEGIEAVAIATDAPAARDTFERERPDVVLCDVMLGERDAGFDLLRELGRRARFLMFTAWDLSTYHARALDDGAAGFVSKTAPTETIFQAIRAVGEGEDWFPPEVLASAASARRRPTPREEELLALLDRGATNEEIGAAMGLRVKSVEGMFRRMFDRYDVDNRTMLARLAIREGWLAPSAGDGAPRDGEAG